MDCPACKEAMITFELDDVEVDYCLACKGIWLDSGELEMLFGADEDANEFIRSFRRVEINESRRKCPICNRKMEKVAVGNGENTTVIDRCGRDDGIWFDENELVDVLKTGSTAAGARVCKLLGEIFHAG